jgi:hypothetical protein
MAISKINSKSIEDGIISADDLAAGSVTNAKLANSSISINGSSVSLGGSVVTGLVWQSVVVADGSTGLTAVAGRAYPINTTAGTITITLPATPSAGDQVQLVDYAGTFDTNALTIDGNGEDIEGAALNFQLTGEREGVILTYINSTQGWIATLGVNEGTDALSPTPYSIEFLVVAGGGGGGSRYDGGGGGAGGYRTSTQTATVGTVITVTVGDGGAGGTLPNAGTQGSSSSISGSGLTTITSAGGGGGSTHAPNITGSSGGSGGGGAKEIPTGLNGNTPSTDPSQGNNGGNHVVGGDNGGGGGGASAVGGNGSSGDGGVGGAGTASSITGTSVTRSGGGGGGGDTSGGAGGVGGGGAGSTAEGTAGDANTGGGGGGGERDGPSMAGGSGGKGVVILSMPLANFSGTTTGSPTESTSGSNKILVFTGSGSYTA